ncbi:MAG: EF-hand domain-containing protein [Thermogutta sp.]
MKLGHVCLVSVVCLVLIGGVAWGEQGKKAKKAPPTPEQLFAQMDTNNDKSVNLDELLAMKQIKGNKEVAEKLLAAWDADKDGKVTQEEFNKFLQAQAQERERRGERLFAKVDLNADKCLSLDEIKSLKEVGGDEAKAKAFLESLDDDKDGKVSLAEFARVRNIFQVRAAAKEKKNAQ